jgi:hypothetical protein
LSGRLEGESDTSETEFVTVTKFTFVDRHAINSASVRRPEIDEYESVAPWMYFCVTTAHVRINQRDLTFRQAADADHLLVENETLATGQNQ